MTNLLQSSCIMLNKILSSDYCKYLQCRADINYEVDFGVNNIIGMIATKWELILLGKWIVFIYNIIFFFKSD